MSLTSKLFNPHLRCHKINLGVDHHPTPHQRSPRQRHLGVWQPFSAFLFVVQEDRHSSNL